MKNVSCIDWLQVTGTHDYRPHLPFKVSKTRGFGNYPKAWRSEHGVLVGVNPDDSRQGWHMVMNGETMQNLRNDGLSDLDMICLLMPHTRKVTRLDYAMDVHTALDFSTLSKDNPRIVTRLSMPNAYVGQEKKGNTQYFGSEDSDVRIRIYDRAAKLDMLSLALTRVEAQTRNKYATNLAKDIRFHQDVDSVGKSFLWSRLKIWEQWYIASIRSKQNIELTKAPRPTANYPMWLSQILQSIGNHLDDNSEVEAIYKFTDDVNELVKNHAIKQGWH